MGYGEEASSGLLYLYFVENTGVSAEILSLRVTSKKTGACCEEKKLIRTAAMATAPVRVIL